MAALYIRWRLNASTFGIRHAPIKFVLAVAHISVSQLTLSLGYGVILSL